MGDLIQIQAAGDIAPESEDATLLSVTNKLLLDDRLSVLNEKTMSVPIAELATLGAGVSSFVCLSSSTISNVAISKHLLDFILSPQYGVDMKLPNLLYPTAPIASTARTRN